MNAHCGKCSHNELMQIDFRNLMGLDLLIGFRFTSNWKARIMKVEKLEEFIPYRKFIENQEIHFLETSHIESISSESQKLLEVLRILEPIKGVAKEGKIRYNFDLDVDILKSITELKLDNLVEVKGNDKGFSAYIK